ncbi:MAG: peptide chain release factor N(5)-glutamine methyltransferase [Alphaproteobacteria bacterium]|nr:peptide chain release factor N(5)-glutamine methyltransferase [Alphaproteobacteria bacterium]
MKLPQTLKAISVALEQCLRRAGVDTPAQDARYMISKRAGLTWAQSIASPDLVLAADVIKALEQDAEAVLAGKPLSRIYGERAFWGRDFAISEHTLDPRADTETLVDISLKRFSGAGAGLNILDLGTGSGCILLTLLAELAEIEKAHGVGVDLSQSALQTARDNAIRFALADRVAFVCGHWGDSLSGGFDLVVSNPPYIANQIIPGLAEKVRKYDPILALNGGDDGLKAYRIIFLQLAYLLKTGGLALFEIGYDQAEALMRLSGESGFHNTRVHLDSGGLPRVLEITRTEPSGDK